MDTAITTATTVSAPTTFRPAKPAPVASAPIVRTCKGQCGGKKFVVPSHAPRADRCRTCWPAEKKRLDALRTAETVRQTEIAARNETETFTSELDEALKAAFLRDSVIEQDETRRLARGESLARQERLMPKSATVRVNNTQVTIARHGRSLTFYLPKSKKS